MAGEHGACATVGKLPNYLRLGSMDDIPSALELAQAAYDGPSD
jgi:hypothetical protein